MFQRHHLSYWATFLLVVVVGGFMIEGWKYIPGWFWGVFGTVTALSTLLFVVGFLGVSLHAIHIHQHREEPVAAASPRKRVARKKEEI